MKCKDGVKATKYQPKMDEWRCPQCSAGPGSLVIHKHACGAKNCMALHKKDELRCDCGWTGNGKTFAKFAKDNKHG